MNTSISKSLIRRKLYSMIIKELKNKLTIGRVEDGFSPFGCRSSTNFIIMCYDGIKKAVDDMIDEYSIDGDISELVNCENDWVLEFLYENIDLPLM